MPKDHFQSNDDTTKSIAIKADATPLLAALSELSAADPTPNVLQCLLGLYPDILDRGPDGLYRNLLTGEDMRQALFDYLACDRVAAALARKRPAKDADLDRLQRQWIREGKYALRWTRLSCHSFRHNAVRLQLHALAYNLANFLRSLVLPQEVEQWSLTSLREKLVKIGARIVRHGRYVVFQLAEVAVPRALSPRSFAGSIGCGRGRRRSRHEHREERSMTTRPVRCVP